MPTVSSLIGPFERFRDQARAACRAAKAEEAALSVERDRLLAEATGRLSARLQDRAPDVEGLRKLGVLQELGLSPDDALASLASVRDAARAAFEQAEARRRQVEAAYGPVAEQDRRRREEARRLRGEAADAAREASAFDPGFLRVHAVVAPEGLSPIPDASLRSPFAFLTRFFSERQGKAIDAVAEYERNGGSYVGTRDGRYLPIVARGLEASRKAELLERDPGHEAAKADIARRRLEAAVDAMDAAEDRMDEADRRAGSPYAAVTAEVPAWFAGLVASFEARALSRRRPQGPDPLGRLWSAGLLEGSDIAVLGHRLALGRAADAMGKRAKALQRMEAKFDADLGKLRRARGNGAGSRNVSLDLSTIEKAMASDVAAQAEAIDAAAGRRSPAAARAAAAVGRDALIELVEPHLLQWVAALGVRQDTNAAVLPGGSGPGTAALDSLMAPGPSLPEFDLPTVSVPDIPSFSIPDTSGVTTSTTDFGGFDP